MAKNSYTFQNVPTIRKPRSRFDLSHRVLTSGNVGTLYPFEIQEVLPGDTFKEHINNVSRLSSTFIRPIMDNLFIDVAFFYVPCRLVWDGFEDMFGKGEPEDWNASSETLTVPSVTGVITEKTVADYLMAKPGIEFSDMGSMLPSDLPFRCFAKIWNEWFRDENNEAAVYIDKSVYADAAVLNDNEWGPDNFHGKLPKVNKFHDYFTSALPSPQKGQSVPLFASNLPVVPMSEVVPNNVSDMVVPTIYLRDGAASNPVDVANKPLVGSNTSLGSYLPLRSTSSTVSGISPDNSTNPWIANLWAINNGALNDIGNLRLALALQRYNELDARGGTRYIEYIMNHFGVNPGDGRVQRSELLSWKRTPISITQVTQTTGFSTDEETPQTLGQPGAYSLSGARSSFVKSFTEPGYVIGVFCIRQFHTYQDGINALFFRKSKFDFYDPIFANIGEQPIYNRELYFSNDGTENDEVFGYNEAWASYRYTPNRVSGQMRSGVTNSLDVWHLADSYQSLPYLNASFLNETDKNVNDVISVDSSEMDQFILDFYVNHIAYRQLPTYSVPKVL